MRTVGASLPFVETLGGVVQVLLSAICCIKKLSKIWDSSLHQLEEAMERWKIATTFLAIQPGGSNTSMQVHYTSYSTYDHQARPDAICQRHT